MIGYQQPCRYCDEFIPPQSNVCPLCSRVNPLSLRCPECRSPIRTQWANCSHCGRALQVECPYCQKTTFFGDYCEHCDQRLIVVCTNPKCQTEQAPLGDHCQQCNKPLTPVPGGASS